MGTQALRFLTVSVFVSCSYAHAAVNDRAGTASLQIENGSACSIGNGPEKEGDFAPGYEHQVRGADPFAFRATDGNTYIYTTNRPGRNVPVYRSSNLQDWTPLGDALPKMPPWATERFTWAPEVIALTNGEYALFYTAREAQGKRQCIGRALSKSPAGPFVDTSATPFLCNSDTETSIDPSPFKDDNGKLFILWKTKEGGGPKGVLTKIWIQPLTADARLDTERPVQILGNDQAWEGKHVEAPTLIKRNGKYFLFYSAGATTPTGYSVSYAVSDSVDGPYRKTDRLLITSDSCLKGPGHQSLYPLGENSYMIFYHSAHPDRRAASNEPARYIEYSYLCFRGAEPVTQANACGSSR